MNSKLALFSILLGAAVFAQGTLPRESGHVNIHVKASEKWLLVEDMRKAAEDAIRQSYPSVTNWDELREVNCWIYSNIGDMPTNRTIATFHYSFGLGNQSFLVDFDERGSVANVAVGKAYDEAISPGIVPLPRKGKATDQ